MPSNRPTRRAAARSSNSRPTTGGWYKEKTIRLTLESFGQPDLWYDALDANSLMVEELDEIGVMQEKAQDPGMMDELQRLVLRLFPGEWNIPDPKTGEPLAPPKDSATGWRRLPLEILYYMMESTMKRAEEEAVPPTKGSRRSRPWRRGGGGGPRGVM